MGVMNCYRKGCDNIMCDRHSDEYGYICYECNKELNVLLKDNLDNYHEVIKSFMNNDKKNKLKYFENSEDCIDDVFKKLNS